MDGVVEVSRAEVERWWRDVADGNSSRLSASCWAEQHLDQAPKHVGEPVLQGLLYLQALRHRRGNVDATGTPDPDVSAELETWRAELARYDADPDLWTRANYLYTLNRFARSHGHAAAIRFAIKLRAKGLISDTEMEQMQVTEPGE